MINFFKKKHEKDINLTDKFDWFQNLNKEKIKLAEGNIQERLLDVKAIHKFLKTQEGKLLLKSIFNQMIEIGFPENSSKIELDLLTEIFLPQTLDDIFYNPSNGLKNSFDNGSFNQTVIINNSYGYITAPRGLVLIVGSSNTILPVITSMILSYISGNVTVCQLSKINCNIISNFINSLPSDCSKFFHFTQLDHKDVNENKTLKKMLKEIPWNVVNVWGGEEANNFYYLNTANNNNRPNILNMEPLTGIVLIQNSYLKNNLNKATSDLASAITEMGQQLCSSPTEGYIINDNNKEIEANFFNGLVKNIEGNYSEFNDYEINYFKLDRMVTYAQDNNSQVFISKKLGNKVSIIKSRDFSVFKKINPNINLSIHERRNFLELIELESFNKLYNLISDINKNDSHKEIKKIQTILVFGDKNFLKETFELAKKIGAYRIVDADYIFKRHPFEALDGKHLVNEFTYQISLIGSLPFSKDR